MRTLALVFSTIFATLTAIPAGAQTFGGNAPICLEKWGWGGIDNISCSYNSIAKCQATASGLSAMCRTTLIIECTSSSPRDHSPPRLLVFCVFLRMAIIGLWVL